MSVKERIILFIKHLNLSQGAFERSCELSNGLVNNIKDSISTKTLHKISVKYPYLNTDWILYGEGEMINPNYAAHSLLEKALPPEIIDARIKPIHSFINIPIVNISAMAGYQRGYGDSDYIQSLPTIPVIIDREYKGKYICFEVSGDSMDDGSRNSLCNHDVLLGRQIARDLWRYKLHFRDYYFIIVHKDGVNVKQIVGHDTEKGIITCHSLNSLYDDYTINLNDVYELFNVVRIVDRSVRL